MVGIEFVLRDRGVWVQYSLRGNFILLMEANQENKVPTVQETNSGSLDHSSRSETFLPTPHCQCG